MFGFAAVKYVFCKMRKQCAAYGCPNYSYCCPPETRFHSFPSNRARCEDWACCIFRADLLGKKYEHKWATAVVCSQHFADHMYMCPKDRHEPHSRLVWNAHPTLKLYKDMAQEQKTARLQSQEPVSQKSYIYPRLKLKRKQKFCG
uniref:THAP-type domain-containing protein n=1 Tax=Macrostomum lignano TaxID=282301 RepID=A0A1I8H2Y2_9PLAT